MRSRVTRRATSVRTKWRGCSEMFGIAKLHDLSILSVPPERSSIRHQITLPVWVGCVGVVCNAYDFDCSYFDNNVDDYTHWNGYSGTLTRVGDAEEWSWTDGGVHALNLKHEYVDCVAAGEWQWRWVLSLTDPLGGASWWSGKASPCAAGDCGMSAGGGVFRDLCLVSGPPPDIGNVRLRPA